MKKYFISVLCLVLLTAAFSFSQENALKFGARAGFNLHNVIWKGKPPGIGMGYGGGITANIPIAKSLSFNPEVNFFYRNVYNHELTAKDTSLWDLIPESVQGIIPGPAQPGIKSIKTDATMKESLNEFAIGIPLMLRFIPTEAPFYLAAGVQLTIPLSPELEQEFKLSNETAQNMMKQHGFEREKTEDFENRSAIDVGIALEAGYYIIGNFAVDFRAVYGFTNISKEKNDRNPPYNPFRKDKTYGLIQYGLGLSYLL